MLEGELTFYLPGASLVIGPGGCAYGPMNVPHTEHVRSAEPVRLVEVNSPASFEKFIAAAGDPAADPMLPPPNQKFPDFERLAALAAEHDIEILGPPGALP